MKSQWKARPCSCLSPSVLGALKGEQTQRGPAHCSVCQPQLLRGMQWHFLYLCSDKWEQSFSKVVHSENHHALQPQGSAGVSGLWHTPCLFTLYKRVMSCRMKGLASDFASLCCHGLFINSLLANLKCHEPDSKLLCKDGMAFLRFLRHVQFQQQRQRKLRTMAQSNTSTTMACT